MRFFQNKRNVNVHHHVPPERHKTHSMFDILETDEYVVHGGHRVAGHKAPAPPMASNAVKAAEANEQHPGIVPYPGRTIKLPHPRGAQVEAISTGDDRWSANPVTRYNPVINNDDGC